jgi:glycerophosphoryl diester phosphodiesterase
LAWLVAGESVSSARPVFWAVGHRGSPLLEVENTLPSFDRALREGANGLELDLSVTRDGQIVVWHDYDLGGLQAFFRRRGLEPGVAYKPRAPSDGHFRRELGELSLPDFRAHYGYAERKSGRRVDVEIPTLERFWSWAVRRPELEVVFLDLKLPSRRVDLVPRVLERLDAILREHPAPFRFVIESREAAVVREVRRLAPHSDVAYDVEPHVGFVLDTKGCSAARAAITHGLRRAMAQKPRKVTFFPFLTHYRVVRDDLRRIAEHNARHPERVIERLCCFTINDPAQMRRLIDLGVSGIQSDKPGLLRQVAEARGAFLGIPSQSAPCPA